MQLTANFGIAIKLHYDLHHTIEINTLHCRDKRPSLVPANYGEIHVNTCEGSVGICQTSYHYPWKAFDSQHVTIGEMMYTVNICQFIGKGIFACKKYYSAPKPD